MNEIWKPIEGTNGKYEVSNTGKVRSLNYMRRGLISEIKPWNNGGYRRVNLVIEGKKTNFLVHRIVAEAFIPNPENKSEVNHIDGNKNNNCVENLEWSTRNENISHAEITGLRDGSIIALLESNKRLRRPIIATNVNTGEKTYYPSIQAAQKAIGTRDINAVLSGKQYKAKGHTYKYADGEVMPCQQ